MKLADAPAKYDQSKQRQLCHTLELADAENRKRSQDVEVHPARLILRSPNGTRYAVTVSNTGTLAATVIP